jgi:hypothetical protein
MENMIRKRVVFSGAPEKARDIEGFGVARQRKVRE